MVGIERQGSGATAGAVQRITAWLRERQTAAGARGFVVGLSGGVDSAVVARLCQVAAPGAMLAVALPCHSQAQDEADAQLVAEHFSMPLVRFGLEPAFDALGTALNAALMDVPAAQRVAGPADDIRARVPEANVKPRLRMTSLYFIANALNYLVAGTGNRCELTIGYFTKYGDGGVDLLPIGHLLKSEVRAVARELGVPPAVIDKPPSAGLWAGQTDEREMGFTYAELEAYLTDGPEAVAPALALKIERLIRATQHKRAPAPVPV
jgi:NAD+ synthase